MANGGGMLMGTAVPGKGDHASELPLGDERLKGIEPKMVELIQNGKFG